MIVKNHTDILSFRFEKGGKSEYRRIQVPPNRFTPLKEHWTQIYEPIVKHMKLQIRMNLKTRSVELRVSFDFLSTSCKSIIHIGTLFLSSTLSGFL